MLIYLSTPLHFRDEYCMFNSATYKIEPDVICETSTHRICSVYFICHIQVLTAVVSTLGSEQCQ